MNMQLSYVNDLCRMTWGPALVRREWSDQIANDEFMFRG